MSQLQRNRAQSLYFYASANGDPQTGDAGSMTASVFKDGVRALATNAVVEEDATHAPGVYRLDLTAAETDADTVLAWITSNTNGVVVEAVAGFGSTRASEVPVLGPFTATGTPTAATIAAAVDVSDDTEGDYVPAAADRLAGMLLFVTDGASRGQARAIVSSRVSDGTLTVVVDAFAAALAAGDKFIIAGRAC